MARRGKAETEAKTIISAKDKSKPAFKSLQNSLKNTSRTLQVVQGPLGPVAGRFTALSSIMGTVSLKSVALAGGFVGLGIAMKKGFSVYARTESQLLQLEAQLNATGFAAGKTSDELEMLAQDVARSTLASLSEVRKAEGILLSFRSVAEDSFDRALRSSQDLAAAGFGSITDASKQLGKALEDPVTGLSSLRRAGVTFSQSQKDVIKQLVETGDKAAAMKLILDGIENQVGGAGAGAAGGISGKFDTLSQAVENFWATLGDRSNASLFGVAIENIATSVDFLTDKLETFDLKVRNMGLKEALTELAQLDREIAKAELGETRVTGVGGQFSIPREEKVVNDDKLQRLRDERAAIEARISAIRAEGRLADERSRRTQDQAAEEAAITAAKERQLELDKELAKWQKSAQSELQKSLALEQKRQSAFNAIYDRLDPIAAIEKQFIADQRVLNETIESEVELKRLLLALDQERALAIDEILNKEEELTAAQEKVKAAADDLANIMGDGFKQATLEGKKFGDVMEDILTRIAERLVEILIIEQTVQAISGGLQSSGGFAGIFGGGGSGGGSAGGGGGFEGGVESLFGAPAGGKAGGGNVAKTGNFMIGESGPEIMTLPKGAHITPNKDIGGTQVTNNIQVINNAPEVEVDTQTERQSDGSELIKFIITTVASDLNSGGQTSRAMQSSFGSRVKPITR